MQDHNGTDIAVGHLVYKFGGDPGLKYQVVGLEPTLVILALPPPSEPARLLIDPVTGGPVRNYPPDNARVKFAPADLVVTA